MKPIWSDFYNLPIGSSKQMLDYEYLFDPDAFLNMEGGKWETFRKNSRKWFKNHNKVTYTNIRDNDQVRELLVDWFERKSETLLDADIITKFVLNEDKDVYSKCLYDSENKLAAINVWDENYKYINFRLCITRNESYLAEFARLMFYTDPIIWDRKKLVNDGGILDSPGLEHFKDKMNPIRKRIVYQTKTL
jgi:hypothetical protein